MFVIDSNKTIHLTRGDVATISVSAMVSANDSAYTFKQGDVVRFLIFKKKVCDDVVLSKTVKIESDTETVDIKLTTADTKLFEIAGKPIEYWYEIELNPGVSPQTIIGYDEDGPKLVKIYPEGVNNG